MNQLLFIAIGGAAGALARHWVAVSFTVPQSGHFPFATLAINAVGSFLIGVFYVLIAERMHLHSELRYVVMVGFLGAFTTFSTFSIESVLLLEQGYIVQALAYIVGSVVLCLLACWSAILITRMV